ncbi:protein QIL1 isoform X2 [Vespula squamosa]|uniref:MICOS complex subunit MIC13 n=1 Tax=Vespula squamosa TaxID=30214 RepID=A0ABD2A3F8_VESSQ
MGLARFTIKASLVGGIIYYSVQEGLWSKHNESLKLYEKIHKNVTPYLKRNISTEITEGVSKRVTVDWIFKERLMIIPPIPSAADLKYWLLTKWNAGVITSIKFVADSPSHITKAYEAVSKFTQEKTEELLKSE